MNAPDEALLMNVRQAQSTLSTLQDPKDAGAYLNLLKLLFETGRRDLPLGRLLEGHIDALQIVGRYADQDVANAAREAAHGGAVMGVWNAELAGEPLRLVHGRLSGAKSYASGAGILSHALVTAHTDRGPQLLLLDLSQTPPSIDRGWWDVIGMARSQTHLVRWSDALIDGSAFIGTPGDYAREPFFSGGALRFVAVHAGGVAAVFDKVRDHLNQSTRADDPHQAARLAKLFEIADLAAGAVRRTAARWFNEPDAVRLPRVAATRMQVADLAQQAIALAQEAVGLQGMFRSHPLATTVTDLMVYLRQPAPDAQRQCVGAAAAAGLLAPAL